MASWKWKLVGAMALVLLAAAAALYLLQPRRGGKAGEVLLGDPQVQDIAGSAPQGIRVSTVVGNGSRVPAEHTCDGADRPLPLRVEDVPPGAKALLILMYDPDAPRGTFAHWLVLVESPPGVVEIPGSPMVEGVNDFRRLGYGGPCPPPGDKPHRYYVVALALDVRPELARGFTFQEALRAAEGHVVSWGYIVLYYSR